MSRDLDDDDYYMFQGGMIPIKWTALEVQQCNQISTVSVLGSLIAHKLTSSPIYLQFVIYACTYV